MAKIHNPLSRGQWTSAVKAALGVTRAEGGVERFGETLTPTFDLWDRSEWAFLRDEHLKGARTVQAAVPAENSVIALVNVVGRNRIVVVEYAAAQAGGGATNISLEVCTDAVLAAALASSTAGPTIGRDTRSPVGTAFLRLGSEVATTLGTSIDFCGSPATDTQQFGNLPVILSPGFGLALIAQTVNVSMGAIFGWYERAPFPGELD